MRSKQVGGYFSLIYATTWEMGAMASSTMLMTSGPAHPQLPQCSGPILQNTVPGYGQGQLSYSIHSYPQDQLSYDAQARSGPGLVKPGHAGHVLRLRLVVPGGFLWFPDYYPP